MAHFFRGSTPSTPFQQAVEKVTDGAQANEDWGTIMKICDHVAVHEDNAKEAVKVIRKRLQTPPTNNDWRTIGLTLTLLEALTKNCGKIFHTQIAQKDFLKDLRDILAPKNNPPIAIQEKVLGMIQTWALAFRDDPDLKQVEQFYQECKQQGLQFPPADPENIIKAAVPATGTLERPTRTNSQPGPGTNPRQNRPANDGSVQQVGQETAVLRQMTPEQIAKLRSELDVVQTNAQVFGEMLVTLQPGEEHPEDFQFLMELHKTCKQMQARIFDLLSQISIDDITVDLLRYNDEFNNSFKNFESYMQERERRVGSSHIPIPNQTALAPKTSFSTSQSPTKKPMPSPSNQNNEPALIKFDEEPIGLSAGLQNLRVNPTSPDSTTKNTQQQSTATVITRSATNTQELERDAKEVEQWLNLNDDKNSNQQGNGTTNAFNDFIEKRASLIPDDPVSEQQIHLNLQPVSNKIEPNNSNA
ncbi:unnamed protein product [Adineta steineri]|uniref:TOM1-like protein 2 n=1 Tax=Adineta steineri TaxID=433720 RepID=A0A814F724_9BILA|nr:unnamed protein product [Adineta steineri]